MGTIAEKLSYLNNTKQLLKDGINDLGGNIDSETTFREYALNLTEIYNDYPKVSDTGTEINLTNTKKGKLTTELNPNEISQESTIGKNLLDNTRDNNIVINGITYTKNKDKSVTANGTATSDSIYYFYISSPLILPAGTYIYNGCPSGGSWTTYCMGGIGLDTGNGVTATITEGQTIPSNYIKIGNGTSVNNLTFYPMISTTGGTYEPYTNGPAPNPDYPFPVHTINGENNIKIENKNLFTGDYSQFNSVDGEGTTYAYFKLPDETKTYIITAIAKNDFTPTASAFLGFTGNGGNANRGFKWLISGSFGTIAKGTRLSINNIDNENIFSYISMFTKGVNNLKNFTDNFYIQLEKGSTATEYTPHQEQNYVINLGDLEYCKIETHNDQIFKNTSDDSEYDSGLNENERYMKKKIKKIVLDGTENWVLNSNYQGKYRYTLELNDLIYYDNNDGTEVSALSDYFKGVPTNEWSTTVNSITVISNKRLLISSEINNVTDFKSWLTTHNIEVDYVLNTPQYINITQNYPTLATQLENLSKAKSYDDETNISQINNDLPFEINIKALMKGE